MEGASRHTHVLQSFRPVVQIIVTHIEEWLYRSLRRYTAHDRPRGVSCRLMTRSSAPNITGFSVVYLAVSDFQWHQRPHRPQNAITSGARYIFFDGAADAVTLVAGCPLSTLSRFQAPYIGRRPQQWRSPERRCRLTASLVCGVTLHIYGEFNASRNPDCTPCRLPVASLESFRAMITHQIPWARVLVRRWWVASHGHQ